MLCRGLPVGGNRYLPLAKIPFLLQRDKSWVRSSLLPAAQVRKGGVCQREANYGVQLLHTVRRQNEERHEEHINLLLSMLVFVLFAPMYALYCRGFDTLLVRPGS